MKQRSPSRATPLPPKLYHKYAAALIGLQAGHLDKARAILTELASEVPGHADSLHCLGLISARHGDYDAAVRTIGDAIAIQPDRPEFHTNLATALLSLGRTEEAIASYRTALDHDPNAADAHYNLGNVLKFQDRLEEAADSYERAIACNPDFDAAYNNLGVTLQVLGRIDAAIVCYQTAIARQPTNHRAHTNLGVLLHEHKARPVDAIACHTTALTLKPDYAEAHYNLGNVYHDTGRLLQAIGCFESALALRPDYAEAHLNLGLSLRELGRFDEADAHFRRSIALNPQDPESHLSRAFLLLLTGDFANGWTEYEWRRQCKSIVQWRPESHAFREPQWSGGNGQGGTILLWPEQGLGDTIQFIRYGLLAARLGWTVVAEVQKPLKRLLGGLPGITVIAEGEPRPPFDAHCPLPSLPRAVKTDLETIPNAIPYLAADPSRIEHWRNRLPADGFRVGIAWQGNPNYGGDTTRSIPLAHFAPLSAIPGVRLFSLQKDFRSDQAPEGVAVECFGPDFDSGPDAFIDTAAIMTHLDLVITSDTAIAHLAGALGVPVWLALKFVPEWRWMMGRDDSPWYPSMRLFRQTQAGDWTSVFARVAEELRLRAGAPAPTPAPAPAPAPALDPTASFATAVAHHRAGNLALACDLYAQILAINPRHADALHLSGVIAAQEGRASAAADLISRAIAIDPKRVEYHTNLATALLALGRDVDAVASYL